MNQVLDKLGIYDLLAVLLPGICITTFSLLACQFFSQAQLVVFLQIEDTFLFFILSYFIGLVFQELSSILQKKVTHKNNKLLLQALDTSKKSHQFLSQEEKEGIFQAVQSELGLNAPPNEEILYNYCKYYLISTGNTSRADKDQSSFGMSRSLSLYFLFLFPFAIYSAIRNQSFTFFVCAISILGLSILLYYRCIRFAKMRYIHILRSFYYSYLNESRKKQ